MFLKNNDLCDQVLYEKASGTIKSGKLKPKEVSVGQNN